MNVLDTSVVQILLVIAAYLLGSINSAILTSQIMRLPDPRSLGSGNPGATNMLRTGSKLAAAVTLLGDLLKGFVPVFITNILFGDSYILAIVGLAALLGHMYSVYYRLKGGKGVATALGILLGLDWQLGVSWIVLWLIVALLFRYSSLAALVATLFIPVIAWLLQFDKSIIALLVIMMILIYWRHRSNIQNLVTGKESKITTS